MKLVPCTAVIALLALTACKPKSADQAAPAAAASIAAADASGRPPVPPADAAAPEARSPPAANALAPSAPMLAYDYSYGVRAPKGSIQELVRKHEQACIAAGPQQCQVLDSHFGADKDETTATLKLRGAEPWLGRFRGGLDADAKAAGGKVERSAVETEDLTRSIVDTGAAVRAKTMLRDRLEKLLAERPGKLSELLELEKQIADVQADIDAAQSELAVMQQRVQMSAVTLSYGSGQSAIGPRATNPLSQALHGFFGNVLLVVAFLVELLSFLLPLGAVAAVAWLVWRRFGPKRQPKAAPPLP